MKVKCIDNTDVETYATKNKIYEADYKPDIKAYIIIKSDTGSKAILKEERFEPIDEPAPDKTQGIKYDTGKLRYDLIPSIAEEQLAKVLTFGANKYGANNWRLVDNHTDRYYAALRRHLEAWRQGEKMDGESGMPHLAHAMCCITFLLTKELEDKKDD